MLATPQDLAMAGLVSFESVQVDKGDPNDPKGRTMVLIAFLTIVSESR